MQRPNSLSSAFKISKTCRALFFRTKKKSSFQVNWPERDDVEYYAKRKTDTSFPGVLTRFAKMSVWNFYQECCFTWRLMGIAVRFWVSLVEKMCVYTHTHTHKYACNTWRQGVSMTRPRCSKIRAWGASAPTEYSGCEPELDLILQKYTRGCRGDQRWSIWTIVERIPLFMYGPSFCCFTWIPLGNEFRLKIFLRVSWIDDKHQMFILWCAQWTWQQIQIAQGKQN